MRLINKYTFYFGTKIPLSEIPDRIHRFLRSQGLKSDRFMYYFEDIVADNNDSTEPKHDFSTHGCERIIKDCPELGNIRYRRTKYNNFSFLTNLDGEPFPEDKFLPLMKKIHKRYGFFSTYLYYSDIDFFGKTIPYEPSASAKDDQNADSFDQFSYWGNHVANSGIEIYRCCLTSDNYISLSVDTLFDGELRDTTRFYNALRAELPKMRSYHESILCPTKEEKEVIDRNNQKAIPVLEKCKSLFSEYMPAEYSLSEEHECSGVAKVMRKISESHGFSFTRVGNGDYKAAKRTSCNAVIYTELSITANPEPYTNQDISWQGICLIISFQGVGFKHELYCDMDIPRDRGAIINRISEVFSVIDIFEKTLLPELDSCFDITPNWFAPSDYFEKEYGGFHY